MTCSCIAEIEQGLPDHKLDLTLMWSRSAGTLTAATYTPLIRKDTGKAERRSGKPSLFAHSHCPFCGVKAEAAAK